VRKVDAEHPVPIDDAEAAAEGAQERKLGEDAVELDFGWHPEHRLETNDTAPMRVGDQGGTPSAAALRGKPHAELSDTRQMAQDLGEKTVGQIGNWDALALKKNDSLTWQLAKREEFRDDAAEEPTRVQERREELRC
jgi:hypothetical protein